MKLGTIKVVACAAALMLVAGCSTMQEKLGMGSETERATAQAIDQHSTANAMQASDSGAGRQIGQAAGKEMFKKVPFLGGSIGGAVGSTVEKTARAPKQPAAAAPAQAPVQPVGAPAPAPVPQQ